MDGRWYRSRVVGRWVVVAVIHGRDTVTSLLMTLGLIAAAAAAAITILLLLLLLLLEWK